MKSNLIPKTKELTYYQDDSKKINQLIKSKGREISPENFEEILKSVIDKITIDDNNIIIELNKNLIVKSDNIVFTANDLNVLLGKVIHLNPNLNNNKIIK